MPPAAQYHKSLGFISGFVLRNKLKHLTRWLPIAGTGYDIGAGLGQYTRALRYRGYDVIGIEPLSDYHLPILPIKGEQIRRRADYAMLINVLHHAEDPVRLLSHLRAICPRIIISEVNGENWIAKLFVRLRLKWERADGQLTRAEVLKIISDSGLKIYRQYSSSFLGIPNVYNWFICGSKVEGI